ncbi:Lipolytic protein G-D-S-L family [Seminavis robusta]|uniref:Lipolytic protein G-D-S-L family n=1 Tax=Seminavis robusta TaxID=568900 RepID=A0A9N8DEK5_9STRA|nr:Lipolytic protein G-D-S-L family [Seminavis robusta]|eukprot:Sro103_g052530.1 Lipolytic protein G-D-S-L family (140) ;mRNA; r:73585-74004
MAKNALAPAFWSQVTGENYGSFVTLWRSQHKKNAHDAVTDAKSKKRTPNLVLYGDSITKWFTGSALGVGEFVFVKERTAYESLLRDPNADLFGLGLGIDSDICTNLLYRIQDGEVPPELNRSVIWILIGSNERCAGASM